MEGTAIWERLKERGYAGSLSAIYRFLAHLDHRGPAATVRAERAPGESHPEGPRVDFGYAGRMAGSTPAAAGSTVQRSADAPLGVRRCASAASDF